MQVSTLALTSKGCSASSNSPLWMIAASRTSSTNLAICSAPISTIEASSRSSFDVAPVDSRPAAPTTAFSWLRTWCPKSARSSASSTPGFGTPSVRAPPSIGFAPSVLIPSNAPTSVQVLRRRLLGGSEHRFGELHTVGVEVLLKNGFDTGRGVVADSSTVRRDADMVENENSLKRDLAVDDPLHLGDAHHLSRAATEPLGLHDDVDGRCDLAADGSRRKLGAGEQDQGFEAAETILRVVGMKRAHR